MQTSVRTKFIRTLFSLLRLVLSFFIAFLMVLAGLITSDGMVHGVKWTMVVTPVLMPGMFLISFGKNPNFFIWLGVMWLVNSGCIYLLSTFVAMLLNLKRNRLGSKA